MQNLVHVAQTRAIFLWILFAIPAASVAGHSFTSGRAMIKGQDLGILLALTMVACAALAWIVFASTQHWSRFALLGLTALATLWALQLTLLRVDQAAFTVSTVVLPAGLAMIALKRMSSNDLQIAVLTMAYSLLVVALVALLGGRLGWVPDGFSGTSGAAVRYGILEWLGIPGRWGGPFGSPNLSAPIGGVIFLLGVTSRSTHRILLTSGGLLVLLLGQSRSTILAVLVALSTYALCSPRITGLKRRLMIWAISAGLLIALAATYVLAVDPTLNGRTAIWSNFGSEFLDSPLWGIGDSGVIRFVNENTGVPGFVPHIHAHSVLYDGLIRYGFAFTAVAVVAFIFAIVGAARGARRGTPGPITLIVFVIVAGLTETLHSWIYWSAYLALVVWAVLAYDTPFRRTPPEDAAGKFVSSAHVPRPRRRQ